MTEPDLIESCWEVVRHSHRLPSLWKCVCAGRVSLWRGRGAEGLLDFGPDPSSQTGSRLDLLAGSHSDARDSAGHCNPLFTASHSLSFDLNDC